MSALNGGLPKKANESIEDFVAEFIDHIAPDEWEAVTMVSPQLRDVLQLVALVVWIRGLPTRPLPPEHPLNPAARYAEAAS